MPQKVKRAHGVTNLNTPDKINPIARDPIDNSTDLERAELTARSKRKWEAPANLVPGKKVTAPHGTSTPLPS